MKYYFNCGSCQQQELCSEYCSGPVRNLPRLCWQWLDCFRGCCLANARQPSRDKDRSRQQVSLEMVHVDQVRLPTPAPRIAAIRSILFVTRAIPIFVRMSAVNNHHVALKALHPRPFLLPLHTKPK